MPVIKVSSIVQDDDLYPRAALDRAHVRALVEAILAGAELPPIVLDKKSRVLIDGYHRVAAWRRVHGEGMAIPAVLKSFASRQEMLLEAMRLNAVHGQPLARDDWVRSVELGRELSIDESAVASALQIRVETATALVTTPGARIGTPHVASTDPHKEALSRPAVQFPTGRAIHGTQTKGIGALEDSTKLTFYVNRLLIAFANDTVPEDPSTLAQLRSLAQSILSHLKSAEQLA